MKPSERLQRYQQKPTLYLMCIITIFLLYFKDYFSKFKVQIKISFSYKKTLGISFLNSFSAGTMTKQKLISLILKKQTYKELKTTIGQIAKENQQSIKCSIGAIQEIMTKQYNAQSRLYALRFLKDSFQTGSKNFIKSTEQSILPVIVNIVIDSTDQSAITKYAGSSFTKTTDLTKFKSIIVSFFKLAKQCVMKWAEWIPNPEYKFKAAFMSLQKKGVRFEYEMQYFRQENYTHFQNNCLKSGVQLGTNKDKQKQTNLDLKNIPNLPIKTQVKSPKQVNSNLVTSKIDQYEIGRRFGPKSKNKIILNCHSLFKVYDGKIKNGTLSETDIEQMNHQINQKLLEYMSIPDLNQNQMESELQAIFENIKNVTQDFQNMKKNKLNKNQLSKDKEQSLTIPQIKGRNSTSKKTETLQSATKISAPIALKTQQKSISKQTKKSLDIQPFSHSSFQQPQPQVDVRSPINKISIKKQEISIKISEPQINKNKKVERIESSKTNLLVKEDQSDATISLKNQKKKQPAQVFEDQASFVSSKIKNNVPSQKQVTKQERVTIKIQSKQNQSIDKKKYFQAKNQRESQNNLQIQRSLTKQSKKSALKEKFDSKLDLSVSDSSRVNFTQSEIQSDENEEESKVTYNFKKQQTEAKLSSIVEDEHEGYGETSRRNISKIQRSSRRSDKITQKQQTIIPNQVKIAKNVIQNYETKISQLEQRLQSKESAQKQMGVRLNQLNKLKSIQQEELEKMKNQNKNILKQFSNAVNAEEYDSVKNEFIQLKNQNKKMEDKMQKLLKQIENLKEQQQNKQDSAKKQKQNDFSNKSKQQIRIFSSSENIPRRNIPSDNRLQKQKPIKHSYEILDSDYAKGNTHLGKIHSILDQNNLGLLKKNLLGANQLFYNSDQMSFICRRSGFKNQKLTLKLQLSFQLNSLKAAKPTMKIANMEEIDVWKKEMVGQDSLYHQEIVVKLKKFPFKLMKIQASMSQSIKSSVLLPFIYFSFLRRGEFEQEQFDREFQSNKDTAIKSKIFNLNCKIVKDFKSLHFYQGFTLSNENRMCFKLLQDSVEVNAFWCQITNLSKLKCLIKIIPQPFNQETFSKAEQLMSNLIFLIA